MYEKFLVALDGSRFSEAILSYARFIAAKLKVSVELLHVADLEAPRSASAEQQVRCRNMVATEQQNSMNYLKKIAASFADTAATNCTVYAGKPAEMIVDRDARDARSLIAMCTHGRSGVDRRVLGSVTDRVVRHFGGPVLVIRPTITAVKK